MARTKSKYRAFRDGGRVDLNVPVDAAPETSASEVPPVPAELPPAPAVDKSPAPSQQEQRQDDATLALHNQIEALKKSEQVRQQAPMLQEPMTREARLAQWQAQLSPAEIQFLQRNPAMVDFPEVAGFAVQQANAAGHQRGTDAHFAEVEKTFNAAMAHLQAQENPQPMPQETPKFFAPAPPKPGPNPARMFSAPVSRDVPTASTGRRSTNGKITLSASEVEAARLSGISVEEYAAQKIKYESMKDSGEYRDARETQR